VTYKAGAEMSFTGSLAWAWDRLRQFKNFLQKHEGAIWPTVAFALLITAGIVVLWREVDCGDTATGDTPRRVTTILLFLWIGWIYAWVIHCFAGDAYKQRSRSIQFAYFFVILSFVAVSIMIANINRASSFGVVEGCVDSSDETSFLPIRCDYPRRFATSEKVSVPRTGRGTSEGAATGGIAAAAEGTTATGTRTPGNSAGANTIVPVTLIAESAFKDRAANAAINHNYHHLLNIGGRLDLIPPQAGEEMSSSNCPARMIHGGVPVPVYFILLSLIGAAISLARNVPVIQRRSEDTYVTTTTEPRLTPGEVRELLAFQILQFVSAPFLAVAAYHTLKPESLATTVALGFLTGFASEKILSLLSVRIKDMKDTSDAPAVLAGQIYGKVRFADESVAGAVVEIAGLDKVKPVKTDTNGSFKFFAVPVSPQPYRLKADAKNKEGKPISGTLDVSLKAPMEFDAGNIQLKE
jgi:hypothetical protein